MMIFAYIYDYNDELYRSPCFDTRDELTDYASRIMANDEKAKCMEVYRDGFYEESVDFDELRDRALLDGYTLPIHQKMLKKAGM